MTINKDNHSFCIILEEYTICATHYLVKCIVGQKEDHSKRELAKEGGRVTFTSKDLLGGNAEKRLRKVGVIPFKRSILILKLPIASINLNPNHNGLIAVKR